MFLAACAAAQTVEGAVINSVTSTGIAGVRVFLSPVSGDTDYSGTTDALGRFLFKDVKPGAYLFGYAAHGYLSSDPMPPPRRVQITAAKDPVQLQVHLTPQPRISGRVVDDAGEGIAKAPVEIIGLKAPPVATDATGKFELLLDPGDYILSVLPPAGLKPPHPEPDSGGIGVWTRTFYPGVALLEAASKIVLRPGSEVSGIAIKLLAVPSHAVRGALLNPDGSPAPKATITLGEDQDSTTGAPMFQRDPARTVRTETNSDGAFEFPQVADGQWRLAAEVESGGQKRRATEWINMAGRESEGVKLRLAPPLTVHGQIIVETPNGLSPPPNPFPIFLVPHGRSMGSDTGMSNWKLWPGLHFEPLIPGSAQIQAEMTTHALLEELGAILGSPNRSGDFRMENVYPGSYRIVSLTPPPPYYMAAVRVGQEDLTSTEINLSSVAAPIMIVYRTDGGSVVGTAEKCASGFVLLIPQDPAFQSLGFLRSSLCDSSDRYEFTAIRPGDYFALAISGIGGFPQLDDTLLSQATRITIGSNATTLTDLRAIPRGY